MGPQTDAATQILTPVNSDRYTKTPGFQYTSFMYYKHNAALNMSGTTLGGKQKVNAFQRVVTHKIVLTFQKSRGTIISFV